MTKTIPPKLFWDTIIIMLNISGSYSIIPYILFFQSNRGITTGIIILLNFVYYIFRFSGKYKFPVENRMFMVYVILMLVNTVASIITNTGMFQSWLYLLSNTSFFLILYNCYKEYRRYYDSEKSLWLILRGYLNICAICVVSCLSLFLLIKSGVSPNVNNVSNWLDLFESNVDNLGHTYYFPYHLSIFLESGTLDLKLPFFSDQGNICGIYYESHILTFMLFPALFYILAYSKSVKKNILILMIWLLVMLLACSTTNILAFVLCIAIMLSLDSKKRWMMLPIGLMFFLLIFYIGLQNTEFFFIMDKLDSTGDGGGSQRYTMRMIEFAFTPKTLLGSNFLNTDYLKYEGRDVGYVSFIFNIAFILLFVLKNAKLILSGDRFMRMIGIGVLYFFIHSMKVNMQSYSLSFLMLMMFILTIYYDDKRPKRNGRKVIVTTKK